MTKKFPQINRRLTAKLKHNFYLLIQSVFLLIMALFTYLNYQNQFFPTNKEYVLLKLATLKNTSDPLPYFQLGLYLKQNGLTSQAEENFQIAHLLAKQKSVLGEQTQNVLTYQNLCQKQQKLNTEITYWQKVLEEKPNFRDGYLQLGFLLYQLGEREKAKEAFTQALKIDPFSPLSAWGKRKSQRSFYSSFKN